jgi:hypothetical protein
MLANLYFGDEVGSSAPLRPRFGSTGRSIFWGGGMVRVCRGSRLPGARRVTA